MSKDVLWISIAILAAILVLVLYVQWNTPRPTSERVADSLNELNKGNLGRAAQELGNETYGDKVTSNVENAVSDTTR
jgi:hypothetical protein